MPDVFRSTLERSALLGLTSGCRSCSGIAAQVLVTPPLASRQPERTLGLRPVKGLFALAALAELVGDQLPSTPSRLAPAGLIPRLVLAAGTAVLVARAQDQAERTRREPAAREEGPAEAALPPEGPAPTLPGVTYAAVPVAVGASLASAWLGHAWRGWAGRWLGRDWPGAYAEDAVALALAGVATRR